jgi:hypothetical protein
MTLEQQVHQNDVKLQQAIREIATLKSELHNLKAELVAKNISSNLSVSGSHCSHPPTYRRSNNDGTPYCAKCNSDIREQ